MVLLLLLTIIFLRLTPQSWTETRCIDFSRFANKDSHGGHSSPRCPPSKTLKVADEIFLSSGDGDPAGSVGAHATPADSKKGIATMETIFRQINARRVEFVAVCPWCAPVCWMLSIGRHHPHVGCTPRRWRKRNTKRGQNGLGAEALEAYQVPRRVCTRKVGTYRVLSALSRGTYGNIGHARFAAEAGDPDVSYASVRRSAKWGEGSAWQKILDGPARTRWTTL